jgi:hypothetical protein
MKILREAVNSTLAEPSVRTCTSAAKLNTARNTHASITRGPLFFALLVLTLACQCIFLVAEDSHLQESGSAALLTRSAFAHGYRHGYEQGFHQGNVDANMARPPKNIAARFKGMPSGYESRFGARKSFEQGFAQGIKAGYNDGYPGHAFRGVAQLREAGASLDLQAPPQDPANLHFDAGVALGYRDGFDRAFAGRSEPQLDPRNVSCPQPSSSGGQGKAMVDLHCDGYRRGYLLGFADGVASQPPKSVTAGR